MLIATTVVLTGATLAQPEEIPIQDSEKVDIHPGIKEKFGQQTGLFSTQQTEKEQIIVSLESDRHSSIEELKNHAEESQIPVHKLAENHEGIEVKNSFWIANMMLIEADTGLNLEEIASVQGVQRINPNFEFTTLDNEISSVEIVHSSSSDATYGLDQINTTETWEEFETKGEDIRVSVLDTGVDESHSDIDLYTNNESDSTFPGGWSEFDSEGNEVEGSTPSDSDGHGTHVSGTVIGGDNSGTKIGVAPEADLMHSKVFDDTESTTLAQILGGFEWSKENDADIISLSLGTVCESNSVYVEDYIEPIRNAEDMGISVISAIGNDEEGCSSSPANVYDGISIGATNEEFEVAEFSGGEKIDTEDAWEDDKEDDWPDEYIVPDFSAPGADIQSSYPENVCGFSDCYANISGTSMATPHVSGAAALMQSATETHLMPDQIYEAFKQSAWKPDSWDESEADDEIDGQDTRYGHGIIDVYEATNYAVTQFDVSANITSAEINDSEVNVTDVFKVSGEIENLRDEQQDVELELRFNDTVDNSKTVNLAEDESKSFSFESSIDEEGFYQVSVNETFAGGLNVEMPPPDFDIPEQELSLSDSEVVENDSIMIEGLLENKGGDGTADLRLIKDNEDINATEINQTSVYADFESSEEFSFNQEFTNHGEYDIRVNESVAGSLDVLKAPELNVTDLSLNNSEEFFQNDTVEASVTAENIGKKDDEFEVPLNITGPENEFLTESISIEAEDQTTVEFEYTPETRGNYTFTSLEESERLEVLKPGSIELENSSLQESEIVQGDEAVYLVDVFNPGDVDATDQLNFAEDEDIYETLDATVESNSSKTVNSTTEMNEPGLFNITVNDTLPQEVEVLKKPTLNQTGLQIQEGELVDNQDIQFNSTVENVGEAEGNFTLPFNFTGPDDFNQSETVEVSLEPEEERNASISRGFEEPGEYNVTSLNQTVGFTILKDAEINVNEVDSNATEIFTGQYLEVNSTLENIGEVDGSDTLNISLGNETFSDSTDTISAEEEINQLTEIRPLDEGNNTLEVNGTEGPEINLERPNVEILNQNFTVSNLGLFEIDFTLNNTDPGFVNETVEASVNDTETDETFRLEPDEELIETLTIDKDMPGLYFVELNEQEVGNFTLDEFAEFSELSPDGETFDEGETVEVSGILNSVGEANISVDVNGEGFESKQDSGESSFSFSNSYSPGSYEWSAEAQLENSTFESDTKSFEVEEEDDTGSGGSSGGSSGSGGLGGAPPMEDPEIVVEETESSLKLYNIFEQSSESLEGLIKVNEISFDPPNAENHTINIETGESPEEKSFETVLDVETSLESFEAELEVSSEWLEQENFEQVEASVFREEGSGWTDLEPEGDTVFNVQLGNGTYGLGVDRACYSMEEVDTVVDDSCMTFNNICEVPEEAEVVDSCSEFERTSNIEQRIQDLENSEESSEQLEEAEQALERGDIETAESILENVEQQPEEEREVPYLLFIGLAGFGLITAIILFVVVRPYYRKKKLISRLASATSKIEERAEKGEDFQFAAEKVAEANKALIEEDYDKAEKVLDDVELVF